jgi:hypothetical protein
MDPIHPITPGPPAIPGVGSAPVERPQRITRERDRPSKEHEQRPRRAPPDPAPPGSEESDGRGDDGELPHIDIRA